MDNFAAAVTIVEKWRHLVMNLSRYSVSAVRRLGSLQLLFLHSAFDTHVLHHHVKHFVKITHTVAVISQFSQFFLVKCKNSRAYCAFNMAQLCHGSRSHD